VNRQRIAAMMLVGGNAMAEIVNFPKTKWRSHQCNNVRCCLLDAYWHASGVWEDEVLEKIRTALHAALRTGDPEIMGNAVKAYDHLDSLCRYEIEGEECDLFFEEPSESDLRSALKHLAEVAEPEKLFA
jgi:hypothetical protein